MNLILSFPLNPEHPVPLLIIKLHIPVKVNRLQFFGLFIDFIKKKTLYCSVMVNLSSAGGTFIHYDYILQVKSIFCVCQLFTDL